MERRQLKSPRSLSGRSIHLTLVTKWSWSWSWMTYCHPLCAMSISPPILRYSYFKIWPWKSMVKVMCVVKGQGHVWPWKFKGQGYGQGQTHMSHLRPGIQSICFLFVSWQSDHFWTLKIQGQGHGQGQNRWSHLNPRVQSICLLFVSWQSDHFWLRYSKFYIWPWKFGQGHRQGQNQWSHLSPRVQSICLLFVSWQLDHFWLRYSKFYIWPWKCKVKVMAKVKPDVHIWALGFNQYVCFSFRGNRTIFGWDIANSIFDLENARSRSWPRSNPMVTFEP